jgi:hypothetical protein
MSNDGCDRKEAKTDSGIQKNFGRGKMSMNSELFPECDYTFILL